MPPPTPDNEAIDIVRAYCGWIVAPSTTEDVVLDGTSAVVMRLPTLHLTELNSLSICGTTIDVDDHSAVEWSEAGYLRRKAGFGNQLRGVEVNITHGYDEWPAAVQVVLDRLKDRVLTGAQSTLVQVGAVRVATGADGAPIGMQLTSVDQAVLDFYRIPPWP